MIMKIKEMGNDKIIEIYNEYMGNVCNCYYRNDEMFFDNHFNERPNDLIKAILDGNYNREDEMLFWGEDDFIETMSVEEAVKNIIDEYADKLDEWLNNDEHNAN